MMQSTWITEQIIANCKQRNELANIELAKKLASNTNKDELEELVSLLKHKIAAVRNDTIKVIYELGYIKPVLLLPHYLQFLEAIQTKDNRMQWGAMAALACIAKADSDILGKHLGEIMETAKNGSVITRDNAVRILICMFDSKKLHSKAWAELLDTMWHSPTNQLPMYAEWTSGLQLNADEKTDFIRLLKSRIDEIEKAPKQKRILSIIKKLSKK